MFIEYIIPESMVRTLLQMFMRWKNYLILVALICLFGYYDHHTANEYVILEDAANGIKIGREMIASAGFEKYKKRYVPVV